MHMTHQQLNNRQYCCKNLIENVKSSITWKIWDDHDQNIAETQRRVNSSELHQRPNLISQTQQTPTTLLAFSAFFPFLELSVSLPGETNSKSLWPDQRGTSLKVRLFWNPALSLEWEMKTHTCQWIVSIKQYYRVAALCLLGILWWWAQLLPSYSFEVETFLAFHTRFAESLSPGSSTCFKTH